MSCTQKVAGSVPDSSYLSVEVSLSETPLRLPLTAPKQLAVALRGRQRRRSVNVCVNG